MIKSILYDKNYDIFLGYIENTDQKEILKKRIKKKLKNIIKKNKSFIFADIGAGEGSVTSEIINFLKKKTNLKVNYIEPSKNLIKIFKKKNTHNFVEYFNKKVEEIKLPSSDFILSSHSIYYQADFKKFVDLIIKSLNKGGIALIVKNNAKSEDVILKKKLIGKKAKKRDRFDIINYLSKKNISFKTELVKSKINISDCFELNNAGKSVISFFYKKPFNEISKEEVNNLQTYLKNNSNKKVINKLEDYIWIFN